MHALLLLFDIITAGGGGGAVKSSEHVCLGPQSKEELDQYFADLGMLTIYLKRNQAGFATNNYVNIRQDIETGIFISHHNEEFFIPYSLFTYRSCSQRRWINL